VATRVAQTASARRRAEAAHDVGAFIRHVDYLLLAAVGGVVAYGLIVLQSVTRSDVPGNADYYVVRQGVSIGLGALAFIVLVAIDPELYRRWRRPVYAVLVALLAIVLVARPIRGATRWIEVGFFRLQPSEIGKVLLAIILAGFLADRAKRIGEWGTTVTALGLAALPIVLIYTEPDLGTALMYCLLVVAALFLAGARWLHLGVIGAVSGFGLLSLLWLLPAAGVTILRKYQLERLIGFLNPSSDPSGSTYNVTQSITAVGSGGLSGRGVAGASQTNLDYLPEHATDFIFSSLAEQRGFLGAALLLLLYGLVVWRGVKIIALAPSLFTAILAGTLVAAFLLQVFVNVGMTIGIAPVTGIPLPFVSYGGSSMIAMLAMIGILQAIHVRGRLQGPL
jgi:rod shape determining protein RodA